MDWETPVLLHQIKKIAKIEKKTCIGSGKKKMYIQQNDV